MTTVTALESFGTVTATKTSHVEFVVENFFIIPTCGHSAGVVNIRNGRSFCPACWEKRDGA